MAELLRYRPAAALRLIEGTGFAVLAFPKNRGRPSASNRAVQRLVAKPGRVGALQIRPHVVREYRNSRQRQMFVFWLMRAG